MKIKSLVCGYVGACSKWVGGVVSYERVCSSIIRRCMCGYVEGELYVG